MKFLDSFLLATNILTYPILNPAFERRFFYEICFHEYPYTYCNSERINNQRPHRIGIFSDPILFL